MLGSRDYESLAGADDMRPRTYGSRVGRGESPVREHAAWAGVGWREVGLPEERPLRHHWHRNCSSVRLDNDAAAGPGLAAQPPTHLKERGGPVKQTAAQALAEIAMMQRPRHQARVATHALIPPCPLQFLLPLQLCAAAPSRRPP